MAGMSLGGGFVQRYKKLQAAPMPTDRMSQGPPQPTGASSGMGGSRMIPGMNQQSPRSPGTGGFVPPGQTGGFVPPGQTGGFVPPGTQPQGGAYQRFQQGAGASMAPRAGASTPFGSTGAQGGYMAPSTGPGDRRYYDQQRNNLMARYDQGSGNLMNQYQERVGNLQDMMKGYGNQQRKDALQRGQNLGSSIQANFTNRGLSGTTLSGAGSVMAANATGNELGRINESLQDRMTGLAERTTGDALGYNERALGGAMNLGQANTRDSRGDMESDRAFGEGQFQSDRAFGRGSYEDDRNFNRGSYEDDRNFGNRNFESDRDFEQRKGESDREYSMRRQMMMDDRNRYDTNRGDRLALEKLGFMERRNDSYPNLDALYAMMQEGGMY